MRGARRCGARAPGRPQDSPPTGNARNPPPSSQRGSTTQGVGRRIPAEHSAFGACALPYAQALGSKTRYRVGARPPQHHLLTRPDVHP